MLEFAGLEELEFAVVEELEFAVAEELEFAGSGVDEGSEGCDSAVDVVAEVNEDATEDKEEFPLLFCVSKLAIFEGKVFFLFLSIIVLELFFPLFN